MGCCASTSRKAPISAHTAPRRLQPWRPPSTPDRERRLPGKHQPRRLNSYFGQRTNIMLRRPLESALAALVGVEDLGFAKPLQSLLQRLNAEIRIHRVRDPPRQHLARGPIHYRNQIQKAAPYRYIRDVRTPDLVWPVNHHLPQQIRIDLVVR